MDRDFFGSSNFALASMMSVHGRAGPLVMVNRWPDFDMSEYCVTFVPLPQAT